jgi:hypothetical protein
VVVPFKTVDTAEFFGHVGRVIRRSYYRDVNKTPHAVANALIMFLQKVLF